MWTFLCVNYNIWYLLCGWLHVLCIHIYTYIIYLRRYVYIHIHVDQVTNQVHELDGITSNPGQCMSPCWQIWGETFLDYLETPLEINMEPENHSLEKEKYLQTSTNHYIICWFHASFRGSRVSWKLVLFRHGLAKIPLDLFWFRSWRLVECPWKTWSFAQLKSKEGVHCPSFFSIHFHLQLKIPGNFSVGRGFSCGCRGRFAWCPSVRRGAVLFQQVI